MATLWFRVQCIVPDVPFRRRCVIALALGLCLGPLFLDRPATVQPASARPAAPNYDETKVGLYTLPDPLVGSDGERIKTAEAWRTRRRPELMQLFETYMFGKVPTPPHPIKPTFSASTEDPQALGGKAIRREVAIRLSDDPAAPVINLLVYLPREAGPGHRVPAFLGLNFQGNHSVCNDPGITLSTQWMPDGIKGVVDHRSTEASRGSARRDGRSSGSSPAASPWPPPITAISTPTSTTGSRTASTRSSTGPARPRPSPTSGARSPPGPGGFPGRLTILETAPEIDAGKVAVMGHSRLGKTALWAGATGPAIRHRDLEQLGLPAAPRSRGGSSARPSPARIPRSRTGSATTSRVQRPGGRAAHGPARADRPDCSAAGPDLSAAEDLWADPKGEFLAARAADPGLPAAGHRRPGHHRHARAGR